MEFVIQGRLNSFASGLDSWIINNIFDTRTKAGNNEVYDLIQASDLTDAKNLSKQDVKDYLVNMIGKQIDGKTLVQIKDDILIYEHTENFGCPNYSSVDGTDNGDDTRTITLEGFMPSGATVRWGMYWGVYQPYSFSSPTSVTPDFTGQKGENYDILMNVKINGTWYVKEIRVGFNE